MNPRPATFGPQWGRIVLLFVGAFATAGVPVGIALASGLKTSGDEVWALLAGVAVYSAGFSRSTTSICRSTSARIRKAT